MRQTPITEEQRRTSLPLAGEDRGAKVREMFARIVPRYDLMNRLMTLGMDGQWRRLTAKAARPQAGFALDLATGTGDLALELIEQGAAHVMAADFCAPMLEAARQKFARHSIPGIELVQADAMQLPFADQSFDCVTSGFLLRNVADLPKTLSEIHRVLRPGGRAVSLEITHMPPGPLSAAFQTYFDHAVPVIGGWISGDPMAYRYLPASVAAFPDADRLSEMLYRAGFRSVSYQRLGVGCVAIHAAQRG